MLVALLPIEANRVQMACLDGAEAGRHRYECVIVYVQMYVCECVWCWGWSVDLCVWLYVCMVC